jgi:hypothetical protein
MVAVAAEMVVAEMAADVVAAAAIDLRMGANLDDDRRVGYS